MTITTGMRFGQYEIAAPLGKGGMGEVYLARDTRLERQVALKILPLDFTQSHDRLRRFEMEAKTVSALNHPNILTIHEIGAQNGTHFIATEYIAGQTLRARLQQPLSQSEAIDIALQITNALVAAHDAQIIHRDIKPENLMLRKDGIVKVLDFGLAKLTETRKAERGARNEEEVETLLQDDPNIPRSSFSEQTSPGTVLGTANYMSPEQARGEKVDARTDIFSLGVVLYEMLAGARPFAGVNMIAVLGAILHQEPAPLPTPAVPDELQRIVTQALHKDRTQRYSSVKDLQQDLQRLKEDLAFAAKLAQTRTSNETSTPTEQASRIPSADGPSAAPAQSPTEVGTLDTRRRRLQFSVLALVAVLALTAAYFFVTRKATPAFSEREPLLLADFENKTGEEIWDGTLKQALAVALEQSPYMNIFPEERARDTLRLMNHSADEPITRATGREICQRRNVRAMLVGTITKLERSYTVTLEATNAQSGETMARALESAEGKDKVLEALGRAAKDLREKLGESFATLQKFAVPLQEATTSSLDALKAFSTAYDLLRKGRQDQAILHYKRAVELDDKFALAWAFLGNAYGNTNSISKSFEAFEKAYQLRERATERERLLISSKYYPGVSGDAGKADEATAMLTQIYPHLALGFLIRADYWSYIGQFERAEGAYREGVQLDPTENVFIVLYLHRLSRFDEAREILKQVPEPLQEASLLHFFQFHNAFAKGETAEMNKQIAWFAGDVMEPEVRMNQAWIAASAGRRRESEQLFQQAVKLAATRNGVDTSAWFLEHEAAMNALLERPQVAREQVTQFLSQLQSHSLNLRITALSSFFKAIIPLSFTVALAGDAARAETLMAEFTQKFPQDTLHKALWAPLTRATIALQRGNPAQAVELLQPALQYEAAGGFMPTWIRGQAYLQLKQGAQAAAEFQKIIDQRGWDVTSPLWPLAHLGSGRAAVLQGDAAKAKQMYDEFFRLWKDADADLPVLLEAKKEYEKLK